MEILLLQTDIEWEKPQFNRDKATEMIYSSAESDLIILPEMFTTGFTMAPETIEEKDGILTLEWMLAVARKRNAAVAGSIAVQNNDKYYNRFYFVKPDGHYETYDKRHLFAYAGECEKYTRGEKRVIVEWKGFRILLQICYDLRFPVFARNRNDYDMIIYVANWPESRISAWETLLKARAVENACYVAGINRVGQDPAAVYEGHSVVFDFKGKEVAASVSGREESIFAAINIEPLNEFREKFPVLADADDFEMRGM